MLTNAITTAAAMPKITIGAISFRIENAGMEESALPLFITYSVNVLGYFVVDHIGGYHGGTSSDSDHTTRNDRLPMSLGSL